MPTILVDLDDFYALVGDGYAPVRIENLHVALIDAKALTLMLRQVVFA